MATTNAGKQASKELPISPIPCQIASRLIVFLRDWRRNFLLLLLLQISQQAVAQRRRHRKTPRLNTRSLATAAAVVSCCAHRPYIREKFPSMYVRIRPIDNIRPAGSRGPSYSTICGDKLCLAADRARQMRSLHRMYTHFLITDLICEVIAFRWSVYLMYTRRFALFSALISSYPQLSAGKVIIFSLKVY